MTEQKRLPSTRALRQRISHASMPSFSASMSTQLSMAKPD